jgi:long-chain fatty acid transport protein
MHARAKSSARITGRIIAVAMLVVALQPPSLFGLGVRIPNQDAEAIARGNAFVASASNPSALYYNPAGIAQLEGHNFRLGSLNYIGITSQYEPPGSGGTETEFEIVPVPHFYYAFSPKKSPLSYGLGVYAPFGLGVEWPEDSGFRSIAIESRLLYITVNPVLAYELHETLAVAMGPTINYSKAKLRQGIGLPPILGGVPNDEFEFEGDDFGYGFNAGIRWQPHQQWAFGANYRSASCMSYEGDSELKPYAPATDTTVEVEFPQIVSAGVSFRPTPSWNIEVAVDWTDWNSVDTLVFEGAVNPLTGQNITLPLNWHSSWFYHFGATHQWQNGYFASLGYFFSENSTSDEDFTPYVPDTDLHVGSLGGGYHGKHWSWALAGQIITGPWRTVSDTSPNPLTGESANGRYRFIVPAVTLSVGYRH